MKTDKHAHTVVVAVAAKWSVRIGPEEGGGIIIIDMNNRRSRKTKKKKECKRY